MTIGFGLVMIDLLAQFRYGRRVRRDPWRATTFEWAMPIPPASYAFASLPQVGTAADDSSAGERALSLARGEGYLGFARNGWQETLGVAYDLRRARAADRAAAPDLPAALHGARPPPRRCWPCCSSSTR